MSDIGQKERVTQNRVIKLIRERRGYSYLGNWEDEERNSPVEDGLLGDWLSSCGYSEKLIQKFYKATALGSPPCGIGEQYGIWAGCIDLRKNM